MTLPVAFSAAAKAEFVEAAAWYEAQRPGLGAEFIAQVEQCVRRIAQQPARYPVVHNGVRGRLPHDFRTAFTLTRKNDASWCWRFSTVAGIRPSGGDVLPDYAL
ncbi:MAG TPA: type II toxin-antitoxin system RelE/ParE family toxin [Immundisolibacter sp.]